MNRYYSALLRPVVLDKNTWINIVLHHAVVIQTRPVLRLRFENRRRAEIKMHEIGIHTERIPNPCNLVTALHPLAHLYVHRLDVRRAAVPHLTRPLQWVMFDDDDVAPNLQTSREG